MPVSPNKISFHVRDAVHLVSSKTKYLIKTRQVPGSNSYIKTFTDIDEEYNETSPPSAHGFFAIN